MSRVAIISVLAIIVWWHSDCLAIENGQIVNRCGLWQRVTGDAIIIALARPTKDDLPIITPKSIPVIVGPLPLPSNETPTAIYMPPPGRDHQNYMGMTAVDMPLSPDEDRYTRHRR